MVSIKKQSILHIAHIINNSRRRSSELHAAESAGPAFAPGLAGEGVPEAERFVACTGDDGLSGGAHGEEEDPAGVPSEGGGFLQRGVLPDGDFVVGVAVRAHDLPRVPGEHQVADLRAGVNAVQQRAVQRIPEFDRLVSRAASRGQHSVVVRAPGQRLHGRAVRPESADGCGAPGAPEEELVVVASRGQQAVVKGPLQPAHLLRMPLLPSDQAVRPLPDVPHHHAPVPRAAGQNAIAPGHRAHPCGVSAVLADSAAPGCVPELDGALAGAHCEVSALGVPVEAGDGVRSELAELEDTVVGGVPEVEGGVEGDREYVEGGPLEQVEVEVVLQVGRVQHLEGHLADLAVLGIHLLLFELALDKLLFLAEEGAALLLICACKGEQFGGVAVEQQAAVHLIYSHLLLLHLPAAHRLLPLLRNCEAAAGLCRRVLAERNEAVSGVPVVLLLVMEVRTVDAELRNAV